ncbi:hypothetical protein WOLCODRAFT_153087 [Wolfiporia cocos MD-104 SS10]|uniref:Uncharacterized protein n=1 Tax=Wolfiporia cocos (strain MD-104) TaxID=742152 RepID=A0A2H3JNG1_WOLCO|nr:hypothetical protein WOLCODRAFT_153087 [Wolfiporia cocos MD-104 SS10]
MTQSPTQTLNPVLLKVQLPQSENDWVTALEIPYDAFPRYSSKPRAWLDYLGYAITGSDGVLSLSSANGTAACDLDLLVSSGEVYFFHTNGPVAFVDPHVLTTVSSHASSLCDSGFQPALVQRDGRCVFTDAEEDCEAARLLAFSKDAEPDRYRLTIHSFKKEPRARALTDGLYARPRSPLPDDWPPELILTAVYGGAAIRAWGPPDSVYLMSKATNNNYYPRGFYKRGTEDNGKESENERQARKEAQDIQRAERREAREQRRGLHDTGLDELDVIAIFWRLHNEPALERAKRAAEAEAKQRSAERVTEWLKGH